VISTPKQEKNHHDDDKYSELWSELTRILTSSPDRRLRWKGYEIERQRQNPTTDEEESDEFGTAMRNIVVFVGDVMNSLIDSRVDKEGGPQRALEIFHLLKRLCRDPSFPWIGPNAVHYGIAMKACGRLRTADCGVRAESLLEELWQRYERSDGHRMFAPDVKAYVSVVHAWTLSNHDNAGTRAERLLSEMRRKRRSYPDLPTELEPDRTLYNAVIGAWAKSRGNRDAPEHASQIVQDMWRMYDEGMEDMAPDVQTYSALINAWSTSRRRDAPVNAERALSEMWMYHQSDPDLNIKPNFRCYHAAMIAMSHARNERNDKEDVQYYYAEKQTELLEDMWRHYEDEGEEDLAPHAANYGTVLQAWSSTRRDDAGKRAEEILRDMWTKHAVHPDLHVKPNIQCYNSVMNAWAKSGNDEAPKKVKRLLEEMRNRSKESHSNGDLVPDKISYNCLIDAWGKNSDPSAGKKAEEVLGDMWKMHEEHPEWNMKPNNRCYNVAMNGWAKKSQEDPNAVENASRLLDEMWNRYREDGDKNLAPNAISYSCLIDAWRRRATISQDAGREAEEVLAEMWKMHEEHPELRIQPHGGIYKAVAHAWEGSNHPDAAENKLRILEEMKSRVYGGKERYGKP